jgi:hypothetical protein
LSSRIPPYSTDYFEMTMALDAVSFLKEVDDGG